MERMEKQMTAVEWFVKEMFNQGYLNDGPLTVANIEHFVQRAKEMEKEQIVKAHFESSLPYWYDKTHIRKKAEQYYIDEFKSK